MRLLSALLAVTFLSGCYSTENADAVYNVFYRCTTDEYILVSEEVMRKEDGRLQREYACAQHPDQEQYPSLDGVIYSKKDFIARDKEDDRVYNIFYH